MSLRSRMLLGIATITLAGGLGAIAQAADPQTAPEPTTAAPATAPAAAPAAAAGMPITEVQDAKKTLAHAKVADSKGDAVGEVKSIKLTPDGKVASISVNVGSRTVALNAEGLTYKQAENTIVSPQLKADIQKLPPS